MPDGIVGGDVGCGSVATVEVDEVGGGGGGSVVVVVASVVGVVVSGGGDGGGEVAGGEVPVLRGAVVITGGWVTAAPPPPPSPTVVEVVPTVEEVDVEAPFEVVVARTVVVGRAAVVEGDCVATCCLGEVSSPVITSNRRADRAIEARTYSPTLKR